jgi:hypothetical protein
MLMALSVNTAVTSALVFVWLSLITRSSLSVRYRAVCCTFPILNED